MNIVQDRSVEAALLQIRVQTINEASKRSRWILLLTVMASIIFFFAYWNSRPASWMRARETVLRDAIGHRAFEPDGPLMQKLQSDNSEYFLQLKKFCDGLKLEQPLPVSEGAAAITEQGEPAALIELRRQLVVRREILADKVTLLTVPFVGVSIDIDDLGLFSGLSLSVLLVMYWFSLSRERDTLEYAFGRRGLNRRRGDHVPFDAATMPARSEMYGVLSATQVLEVPPPLDNDAPHPIRASMNRVLSLPPLAVQALILSNDIRTMEAGEVISRHPTMVTLMASSASLAVIFALSVACMMVHRAISRLWRDERDTIADLSEGSARSATSPRLRAGTFTGVVRKADQQGADWSVRISALNGWRHDAAASVTLGTVAAQVASAQTWVNRGYTIQEVGEGSAVLRGASGGSEYVIEVMAAEDGIDIRISDSSGRQVGELARTRLHPE